MDQNLRDALKTVRSSPDEAKKFSENPKGYLESKGVDTSDLKFGKAMTPQASDASICGTAGCVVCVTVGI